MTLMQRAASAILVVSMSASAGALGGCTSMKSIKPVTTPAGPSFEGIRPGDVVVVRMKNGREEYFVVQAVNSGTLVSTSGVSYPADEVVELRRQSPDYLKTTLLVAGLSVGAFFLVAGILFAAWN